MAEARRRRSVSQGHLLDLVLSQLSAWRGQAGPCDVVDVGGGTGGVAIALAGLGHRVMVVDPSPDALASLQRRTAEADPPGEVRGVQGDAGDVLDLVGQGGADLVVCHRVLEVVDEPGAALAAMAAVLRPGGVLSLAVSQRHALVLSQALAGHIALARRTFADTTRYDHDAVVDLVGRAGFRVLASHGVGAIADHVPEALIEAEPGAHEELLALERETSQDPAFRALAPVVHVFAEVSAPVA